jgi:hypothetical protein
MNQPSGDLNKDDSNLGSNQFDYSGLTAPESMGGKSDPPSGNPAPPPPPPPAPATPSPVSPSGSIPEAVPPASANKPDDSLVFPQGANAGGSNPNDRPHVSSGGSWLYIILLTILLALAIVVFLSWKGLINLGGVEKLWGGVSATPTPSASVAPSSVPSPGTNDATRKGDLARIQLALKNYYADNAKYPESAVVVKTSDPQSVLALALVTTYIPALPDDPLAPKYYYGYKSDGRSFTLTCVLEDQTDASGVISGNLNIYTVTNSSGQ